MVEPVGGKASGVGVDLPRKAQTIAAAPDQQTAIDPSIVGIKAVSPRMRADPIAGILITEYLSNDGQVERQFPSEAAVAYLRSGLMQNGRPDPDKAMVSTEETLV